MANKDVRKTVSRRIWLKEIRENAGRTQVSVAKECEVAQAFICDIENGRRSPTPKTAKRIGAALNFEWTRFFE